MMQEFESLIMHMFSSANSIYSNLNTSFVSYDSNNIFNKYLNIDLRGDVIESPIMCVDILELDLYNKLKVVPDVPDVDYCVCPLYMGGADIQARTIRSILKTMLVTPENCRLSAVTSAKGEKYYGGLGIIFDSTMTCILFCTVKYILEGTEIKMTDPVMYIHPKVFSSNGIVEKNIIKKIIPIVLEKGVALHSHRASNIFNYEEGKDPYIYKAPRIVVSERANNFLSSPDVPILENFTNEKINEYLADNIDVNMLKVRS